MLIKSQDEKCIVPIEGNYLIRNGSLIEIYTCEFRHIMGAYSSEEVAKEVMCYITDAIVKDKKIYVMPEE